MKNYLHIPLAIALIVLGIWGCIANRPVLMSDRFPEEEWTSVTCNGTQLDPEEVKAMMEDTVLIHRTAFTGFSGAPLRLLIQSGTTTYLAELGEDGSIVLGRLDDLDKTKTFWLDADSSLYQKLAPAP